MARIVRSAMIQVRVTPGVKRAGEEILHRIGLKMTEAMELFLRRVIVDQRLPFDVVALDDEAMAPIAEYDRVASRIEAGRRKRSAVPFTKARRR